MVARQIYRYSMGFKQQVVKEIESGRFSSISDAREHFGINGAYTIQSWLRRFGRNHLCAKVVRVETHNEPDEIRKLKKRIKELERALGRTQAGKILEEEFLKIACEELGRDVEQFKKKADTGLSHLHKDEAK